MTSSPRVSGAAPVLAHYMPWFRAERNAGGSTTWEHWAWAGPGPAHDPSRFRDRAHRDIASVYYPLIGPYDGRDPHVLEYHMLTAKASGIDGFVADWYGPGDFTDRVFAEMVRAAERCGMTVAICLEEKTFFPPRYSQAATRAEALDVMEGQIRHVLDGHAKSPAYLRHAGAAVFFVFPGYQDGPLGLNVLTPGELCETLGRFRAGEILHVHSHIGAEYSGATPGRFSWNPNGRPRAPFYEAMQAARARGERGYWVGGACPGFNDTGVWGWGRGPRVTDRRGTREYEENWDEVLRHGPDAVQIGTWNDFGEGTTIEPAEEYGFTFLDLTERCVEQYNGRRAQPDAKRLPLRLFRLRQAVATLPDPVARAAWARQLDGLAADLARGDYAAAGSHLERWESTIPRLSEEGLAVQQQEEGMFDA